MITDKLTNIDKYPLLAECAEAITAFVKKVEEENLPMGRYDLDGDNLFALLQTYTSKPKCEARMEAHKLYTDLQYIMEGEECIYWSPIDVLTVEEDRTPEADLVFYKDEEPMGCTKLTAGMFGVYIPTDGHMPSVAAGECAPVKKIVFKIRCK